MSTSHNPTLPVEEQGKTKSASMPRHSVDHHSIDKDSLAQENVLEPVSEPVFEPISEPP